MSRRLIESVHRLLGKHLNIKISNYRKFQELLARAQMLAWVQVAYVDRDAEPHLGVRSDVSVARAADVPAIEAMYRAQTRQLNTAYQQFISRQMRSLGVLIAATARRQNAATDAFAGGAEKRRVAVIVMTSIAQFTQLKVLASSDLLRAKYELVVVGYLDAARSGIFDYCRSSGVTLLSEDLQTLCGDYFAPPGDGVEELPSVALNTATIEAGERASMRAMVVLLNEIRRQRTISLAVRRLLRQSDAALLVLFEDNAEYDTGIWVTEAQEMSIPSVIIPYTIADALEPAQAHHHDPTYWPEADIHNRLAQVTALHWMYFHRGRWLVRRPGAALLAAEALGTAVPAPWVLNSSKADAIAVESEAMRRHYLVQGIPETQLVVTGSLTDDRMHAAEAEQDRLRAELRLDGGRPVLLCSIPPNQLTTGRPGCEFASFGQIADFWIGELKKLSGWQILLKPHPAMRAEDLAHLRSFGLTVCDQDTMSLIPLCDIYNPSVSSTIRWALACGKPVLNYDVYKYDYRDFNSEPAVLTVSGASEFSEALHRLTGDRKVLEEFTSRAATAATRWGLLDGRCVERVVDLFDSLVKHRGRVA